MKKLIITSLFGFMAIVPLAHAQILSPDEQVRQLKIQILQLQIQVLQIELAQLLGTTSTTPSFGSTQPVALQGVQDWCQLYKDKLQASELPTHNTAALKLASDEAALYFPVCGNPPKTQKDIDILNLEDQILIVRDAPHPTQQSISDANAKMLELQTEISDLQMASN